MIPGFRCVPACTGCAQERRHPDDLVTCRTHQLEPETSCEEAEARRAVATPPPACDSHRACPDNCPRRSEPS